MYYEMYKGFEEVKEDVNGIKQELRDLNDRQIKIESKLEEARKSIYIGHIQDAEAIKRVETKIDELSYRIDEDDVKIQVIEVGEKAL